MKKYLLSLLVGFVGIISFCSANGIVNYSGSDSVWLRPDFNGCSGYISCTFNNSSNLYFSLSIGYYDLGGSTASSSIGSQLVSAGKPYIYHINQSNCSNLRLIGLRDIDGYSYDCYIYGDFISSSGGGSCPECPSCPEVNTGELLSGYILESEVDENYCVSNNLCPLNTGDSASWSELVINDIVHESAPLINISIPQEYSRDYSVDENEFTLDISGYNVDYDYIDGIIKTQNSKPTVEDFNKIISELLPLFVPGLVIILFLIFVFRFVKKIF